MIDRRTFLKLSAGALVLTAAGALTGCGETVIDKTSGVAKIGDVTFICAKPFPGGGDTFTLTYQTQFTIQNKSAEKVVIKPEDITCIFREADTKETLYFKRKELVAEPGADDQLQWLAGVLSGNQGACAGKEQSRHLRTACALQWSNRCIPLWE